MGGWSRPLQLAIDYVIWSYGVTGRRRGILCVGDDFIGEALGALDRGAGALWGVQHAPCALQLIGDCAHAATVAEIVVIRIGGQPVFESLYLEGGAQRGVEQDLAPAKVGKSLAVEQVQAPGQMGGDGVAGL